MHARILNAIAMTAFLLAVSPVHAQQSDPPYGNRDNWGWTDGGGVGAKATQTATEKPMASGSGGGRGGGTVTCTYMQLPPDEAALGDALAAQGQGAPRGSGPGTWYAKMCIDTAANTSSGTVVWVPATAPADPVALAEQALRYVPLPLPGIGMNPPAGRDELVNVPIWLWVDPTAWTPVSASASAGGVNVVTTATPQRVVWDMGDGGVVACPGAGTPYDPAQPAGAPTCSYTYRRPAERLVVTATIEWSVAWRSTSWTGGDLGVVRRASSVPVRVAESQAVNTPT
jgi:hypothetical protein